MMPYVNKLNQRDRPSRDLGRSGPRKGLAEAFRTGQNTE